MKKIPFLFSLPLVFFISCSYLSSNNIETNLHVSKDKPMLHLSWTDLLQKHVSVNGKVDYKGFKSDSVALSDYLNELANHIPADSWSQNEKLAYWINAYNAFTVQLIIRNYPVKSIRRIGPTIGSPWGIKFVQLRHLRLTLGNIEHDILRKMNEPRIHFAINCASISCPNLLNVAYEAEGLHNQLNDVTTAFINNPTKNKISKEQTQLSKIFKWFTSDFGDLPTFISQYSTEALNEESDISYLPYDWDLNE
ncbi:MAG: DUF547 domain-containing protein [Cyclobacteriaceae bacterium]